MRGQSDAWLGHNTCLTRARLARAHHEGVELRRRAVALLDRDAAARDQRAFLMLTSQQPEYRANALVFLA